MALQSGVGEARRGGLDGWEGPPTGLAAHQEVAARTTQPRRVVSRLGLLLRVVGGERCEIGVFRKARVDVGAL